MLLRSLCSMRLLIVFIIMSCPYIVFGVNNYPNFDDNPHISDKAKRLIRPYLLPLDHPTKPVLDAIFSGARVSQDKETLAQAGFSTICSQKLTHIEVVRHPALPGYLLKIFLDSSVKPKENKDSWEWLVRRCYGAKRIRRLINKYDLQHFSVPDKFIYPLPAEPSPPNSPGYKRHIAVLLVTDMDIVSHDDSRYVWSHFVTREQIDELFCIITHGCASSYLGNNIPCCRNGKFACIDTEHPKRRPKYKVVEQFLGPEMRAYWRILVELAGQR